MLLRSHFKLITEYMDERHWICHKTPEGGLEGGDGLNRLAIMKICGFMPGVIPEFATAFNDSFDGTEPTRHWDRTKWYGQKGTLSRDNLWPWLISLGLANKRKMARYYLWLLIKRFGFFWNTKKIWETEGWKIPDWAGLDLWHWGFGGPNFWASAFRAAHLFIPIWWLTDFLMIFHSLIRVVMGYFQPHETSDDIVHQLVLWQHLNVPWYYRTPMGYAAWVLYWLRPPAYHIDLPGVPMSPFTQYFYPDSAPPIHIWWADKERILWLRNKRLTTQTN